MPCHEDIPGFDAVAKGEKVPLDIVQPGPKTRGGTDGMRDLIRKFPQDSHETKREMPSFHRTFRTSVKSCFPVSVCGV